MPLIAPDHIESATGRLLDVRTAEQQRAISGKYRVDAGDIIYSKIRPYLQKAYLAEFPALCSADMYPLKPKPGVDGSFIVNTLLGEDFTSFAVGVSMRSGIPKINRTELAEYRLAVPPSGEQERIGATLADTDALIRSLERLIVKKRDLKRGLMHELLTGRTRLPSFAGDWTTLRVAAVSHLKARIGWQGLTTEEYRASGSHRLVGGTDFSHGRVNWNSTPYVDKWRYDQDPNIQLRLGDVLITKDGTIGKVALVDHLPGPTTLNSGVFVLRPKQGAYDPTFLFCMLRSRAFDEFVAGLSAGSTINHLYQKDLVTLEFQVPPRIEEQAAIAKVILDVDAELTALDRRLLSACNIKQGMMQQLLSGRTRLVSEVAA